MKIADSHSHLHFPECRNDVHGIMSRAVETGLEKILLVGIDPEDCINAITLSREFHEMYVSIGIHPQLSVDYSCKDVEDLSGLKHEKVVAVGETGFDLYRAPGSFERQRELFEEHIKLAKRLSLPLVIHDRDAHDETIRVLDEKDGWATGGVMHCFSGDERLASYVLSKGFFISIPGVITYKNATVVKAVAASTPIEKLLIETDAPYLSPNPYRGKRNEPAYLVETLRALSAIKKIDIEALAEVTSSNFEKLFLS